MKQFMESQLIVLINVSISTISLVSIVQIIISNCHLRKQHVEPFFAYKLPITCRTYEGNIYAYQLNLLRKIVAIELY